MATWQWQLSIVELRIRTAAFKERPFSQGRILIAQREKLNEVK